jgi:anaerobic selenocysteine-containing dehydrogenase
LEIRRRDFLKLLGGVAGTVAISSYGLDQIISVPEKLIEKVKNGPGIETWKSTICDQCPGGCGIKIRMIDNIPVFIKGNPVYPVNQGGICPLGRSGLEVLFNPDRIKEPMKRIGIRGSGKWEAISWDEALDSIVGKLLELRSSGKSHQVSFLGYNERGLMKEHISRFMQVYGSPNYFQSNSVEADIVPFMLVQGRPQIPAYDFLNTKLILNFGSNFLEEGYSPVYYTKLYSKLRGSTRSGRSHIIHIDSRMSLTAANADRWIPIRPGSYGALALGIAYVLIREELYHKNFIKNNTFGFEDWSDKNGRKHLGFRRFVLENYYPEQVSKITDVPSETILEIARELGNTSPAFVIGNHGTVDNTNGTFSQIAVHSLNALLGNFEKAGGLFFSNDVPFSKLPGIIEDDIAKAGNQQESVVRNKNSTFPLSDFSMESFTKNILSGKPYDISLLFLYKGNALFHSLNQNNFIEALKKIPLIVSFDSFINETNEYADIILPDHTFLEKWDEISNVPSVGFTHVGLQKPVIEPLYNTRQTADVLINLAKRIGGNVAKSFPYENYQKIIKYKVESIYKSGEGAIASESVKQSWLEYLQQRGWHIGRYDSFDEFWELLLENGGWWNPIRKKKNMREIFVTPSGKFEFYSLNLKKYIDKSVEKFGGFEAQQSFETVLNNLNITARGDSVFLPHHESVPYDEDMPLYFTTFQLLMNRDGNGSNQPLMQEMFGYITRQYWRSWAEINPVTAKDYGISDGDWIRVESKLGTIKVKAKIHPGITPAVVSIPFGLGHTSYGRYAKGFGVNPNSIINNTYDMISGRPALQATKVKISTIT